MNSWGLLGRYLRYHCFGKIIGGCLCLFSSLKVNSVSSMPYLGNFLLFHLNCHVSDVEDILINCGICIPMVHILKLLLFVFSLSYCSRLSKLKETFKSSLFLFLKPRASHSLGWLLTYLYWSLSSSLKAHTTSPTLFNIIKHCSVPVMPLSLQPISLCILILRNVQLP